MPYIKPYDRALYDRRPISSITPETVGDLNYCITSICNNFLKAEGKSYATVNDIIGVLECAKMEFYRRVAAPYEDIKLTENGDVY